MPESEVGPLADLRSDERAALALVVAHAIDQGIHHFLYGLWNQPDGFELRYRRAHLNAEGEYFLIADTLPEISEESAFDRDGNPKE